MHKTDINNIQTQELQICVYTKNIRSGNKSPPILTSYIFLTKPKKHPNIFPKMSSYFQTSTKTTGLFSQTCPTLVPIRQKPPNRRKGDLLGSCWNEPLALSCPMGKTLEREIFPQVFGAVLKLSKNPTKNRCK